jgi:hypothetical protein
LRNNYTFVDSHILRENTEFLHKAMHDIVKDILKKNPDEIHNYISKLSQNIEISNKQILETQDKLKEVNSKILEIVNHEFTDRQLTIYIRLVSLVSFVAGGILGVLLSESEIMKIVNAIAGSLGVFFVGSISGAVVGAIVEKKPIAYAYQIHKEKSLYRKLSSLNLNILLDSYVKKSLSDALPNANISDENIM